MAVMFNMKLFIKVFLGVIAIPLLWVTSVMIYEWRDPTTQEIILADKVAAFCAYKLGDLPQQTRTQPASQKKTISHRAATNGLVVIILYGFNPDVDKPTIKEKLQSSFTHFHDLKVISVEYYSEFKFSKLPDGTYSPQREIYLDRQTIDNEPKSM